MIAFKDGALEGSGRKKALRVVVAGFFKFIFPPVVIYWSIQRGFSIIFVAAGMLVALVTMVFVLAIFNRSKPRGIS